MGKDIVVLGSGSWGTALAHLLASAGHKVSLLARDATIAASINGERRENGKYLPGIELHPGICALADSEAKQQVLSEAEVLVLSIPCQSLREALRDISGRIRSDCVLVNTAKGIEISRQGTIEQIIAEELPEHLERYAVLSGPSFAAEVAQNKPTAVVLGCRDTTLGTQLREIFATSWFRSYSSTDVTGVELGGAIKNIIALAAGISDGLAFGLNARAALVTRGLAETSRLGVALGARPITFMGLSGLGDLMLTTSGDLSRNRQVGLRLGQGEGLCAISSSMHNVAEGVKTTEAVYLLAKAHGVDMPVTNTVHAILYENLAPRLGVQSLMSRQLRVEFK